MIERQTFLVIFEYSDRARFDAHGRSKKQITLPKSFGRLLRFCIVWRTTKPDKTSVKSLLFLLLSLSFIVPVESLRSQFVDGGWTGVHYVCIYVFLKNGDTFLITDDENQV